MVNAQRKPWVGGNWKCNGTEKSNGALVKLLNQAEWDSQRIDVVIFPSPIHMLQIRDTVCHKINVGSQNISLTGFGAYTGEMSCEMVKDAQLKWALIGHSERRQYYGEKDSDVAIKLNACHKNDLFAVICIGENLQQRESGETEAVLASQLNVILDCKDWSKIVIAYEPVWAIGTGVVASVEQVKDTHAFIRSFLHEKKGNTISQSVRIVYGGSVNAKNCEELSKLQDVDGFLVGGASLKPEFVQIVNSVI
ncbi:triosephosphate isomerase A-like [Hylaeus volcanicus]|uniref:triosephosphate isomerase A-like n=1 Tax=Hylaeus volcanicus TaxID=313075 RepID=UPI0023B79D5A|nr:triosephosphate isomerase A-like [Hylaeus volcanicus]XP_053991637.1 triosephosphate isomerase A-like [Hylaeus volcanicus]